jgi:predicted aconitase with swiveling domain
VWAAGVFVTNTVLVVAFQVPVTVWMSRFPRRKALAISGIVLTVSYLGFLAGVELGHGWAAPAPEHALGRALARLQLSTGFGLAVSSAVITALAARGAATLWVCLAAATLLAAAAVDARPAPHA